MTSLLGEHDLDNVDCDICNNTGYIVWDDNGFVKSRECECMAKRRTIRRLKQSGMEKMFERYTFDTYETVDRYRELVLNRAIDYVNDSGNWFYIYGQSGSGKTHICTAVCKAFLDKGIEVYYMNWREESVVLKAEINSGDPYTQKMNKLKSIPVLYIDDFLKAGNSPADIKLAFEILNARYNKQLRTVISSELTLEGLFEIDEAIAGRIYELSFRPRYLIKAPKENWRRRQLENSKKKMEEKDGKQSGNAKVENHPVQENGLV